MIRPSRVLFVLHRGGRAGTEYHVLWLASELRARGWTADLAVSEAGPILANFRAARVEVHLVRRTGGSDPQYVRALARLARSLAPDVVHAHSGRVAALAARIAGIPAIVETRHGLGPAPRVVTEAQLCRLAHHTLTVCGSDRGRLICGGLSSDRVTAVQNGIPIPPERTRSLDPERLRLGFIGRMTEQKNPIFLLSLVQEIEARMPGRWSLVMAGEGPMRPDLERRLAERPDLASSVHWLGETEGPSLVLERSDFICIPSLWEGQPLAALEAMAAGVVPIAAPLPSLVELLAGDSPAGLSVDLDAAAWAVALLSLHGRPSRFDAIAREGRSRILRDHRIPSMVDRIEGVYRHVFASRERG